MVQGTIFVVCIEVNLIEFVHSLVKSDIAASCVISRVLVASFARTRVSVSVRFRAGVTVSICVGFTIRVRVGFTARLRDGSTA